MVLLLLFFLLLFKGQANHHDFHGGIEFGSSITTIQGFLPYYGFFDHPYYNKCLNGTAGVFVNRFIHGDYLMEMGFYYKARGTRFMIYGANSGFGFRIDINYLEVPLALYHYPNENSCFSYRYGISFSCLLDQANLEGISYRNHDVTVSFGIRFKPEKSRLFKSYSLLQKMQFVLKLDGSVFPISNPEEIKILNYSQPHRFQHNLNHRNMGLTFSVQCYLKEFSR